MMNPLPLADGMEGARATFAKLDIDHE